MKLVILLIFISSSLIFSQPEYKEWSYVEVSYEIPVTKEPKLEIDKTNIFTTVISTLRNGYQIIISDVDGDNCPFYPSCSHFFIQSVRRTNLLQSIPMFFDRFTRDSNLFKDQFQYPRYITGRFYDPIDNYTLDPRKIKFIPYYIIVNE